jgi:hypothetical protein
MPKASARVPLEKESDVLFLLKRQPALVTVLKQLDLRLTTKGRIIGPIQSGCPFSGCQPSLDLRELIERGQTIRTARTGRTGLKAARRKRAQRG